MAAAICLVILGVLLALLLIAVVRTLSIKAPPRGRCTTVVPDELARLCGRKLAEMVRIPTVSKREDEDLSDFVRYQKKLDELFPLVCERLEKTVLNGTLLYRWPGRDPKAQPILLMGHQDVVPASDEGWKVGAYSGEIVDGCVYGRGALDCKGTMLVELEAVEELLAEGFTPASDVWLEYSINEETGGDGAAAAMRFLRDRGITLALVLDEGGGIIDQAVPGMDRPYAVIGITEKGYMDLKITAVGKGGHSSTPPRNTPAARLYAFANEIERKRPFERKLLPEVVELFRKMAPSMGFGLRLLLGNLWLFKPLVMAVMPMISPFGEALMATTCCFTMMKGSDAPNVIPKAPYLVANLRTAPHQSCKEALAVMQKYADKYGLTIEVMLERDASPVSDIHSREYAFVTSMIEKRLPDCGVAPYMIMGGTDCRHFHAISDNALRFCPIRTTTQQNESCHAVNENVDITCLGEGVLFYKELLETWQP